MNRIDTTPLLQRQMALKLRHRDSTGAEMWTLEETLADVAREIEHADLCNSYEAARLGLAIDVFLRLPERTLVRIDAALARRGLRIAAARRMGADVIARESGVNAAWRAWRVEVAEILNPTKKAASAA